LCYFYHLLAGATVASVVVASTASASAVYEDFETEGATYGVIGDFNTWEGDVALTDEDGDGLYTATASVPVVSTPPLPVRVSK